MDLGFEALHAHPEAGVPAPGIRVRGRGFVGYTSTTDRTGRIMPVAVIAAMPMAGAHAPSRRSGGTGRRRLARWFDMACKGTRWHGPVSSVAVPHRPRPLPFPGKRTGCGWPGRPSREPACDAAAM